MVGRRRHGNLVRPNSNHRNPKQPTSGTKPNHKACWLWSVIPDQIEPHAKYGIGIAPCNPGAVPSKMVGVKQRASTTARTKARNQAYSIARDFFQTRKDSATPMASGTPTYTSSNTIGFSGNGRSSMKCMCAQVANFQPHWSVAGDGPDVLMPHRRVHWNCGNIHFFLFLAEL